MSTQFQIKKGLSTNLFDSAGKCILKEDKLIENCWYLTVDTAEVYVCLKSNPNDEQSSLVLKKINGFAETDDPSFDLNWSASPSVEFISTYTNLPSLPPATDTIFVVNDENASYVWSNNNWVCIGRDYNEIQIISGGDANPADD